MLEQLDENLWVAQQPFNYFGLEVGTRMTVVRFDSEKLAVISPIELTAALKQQIDKFGAIAHIADSTATAIVHHYPQPML